jgi:hypothetical protein
MVMDCSNDGAFLVFTHGLVSFLALFAGESVAWKLSPGSGFVLSFETRERITKKLSANPKLTYLQIQIDKKEVAQLDTKRIGTATRGCGLNGSPYSDDKGLDYKSIIFRTFAF